MDRGLCLPEEPKREYSSGGDRGVLEITYRELHHDEEPLLFASFLGAFHDFWVEVNGHDLSHAIEYEYNGITHRIPCIEALYYSYVTQGAKVQLALEKEQVIGFLLYHAPFGHVVSVRAMWAYPEFLDRRVGKGMLDSLEPKPKKIIFQTRKRQPPEQMLRVTEKYRTMVAEDEYLITWEMPWR